MRSFAFLALVAGAACSTPEPKPDAFAAAPLRGLATAPVAERDVRPSLSYLATLRAARDASLSTAVGGRVEKLSVQIGDRVKRGAELVRLRDVDARAAAASAGAALAQAKARAGGAVDLEAMPDVRAARIALESARDARERMAPLLAGGAVSEQDVLRGKAQERTAESQLDAARALAHASLAAVDQARAQSTQANLALSELTLRAPFDGVVVERAAREGETVAAGAILLRVVDDAQFRLEFDVPQHEAHLVALGASVRAEGARAADGAPLAGPVARLSAALDGETRLRRAEVDVATPAASVLAGARVRMRVETGPAASHPVVPCRAVRTAAGVSRIWVLEARRVEERLVVELKREPGGEEDAPGEGERCVLDAGAKAGERVVLDPPAGLQDGDEVAP